MKTYAEEKRIRPDILTAAVYWSSIIMMLYNIIAVRIFGDKGAGFCAVPLALYFLFYVSFVLAVQKSVYIMVRLRARRSQFMNAEINMHRSMQLFVAIGIVLAIIVALSSFSFSKSLLGSGRVYFQIIIAAVSLIFLCPQGVIRGYLQGLGYTRPIVISDLLISVTSFISGGIISVLLFGYGKKVNNLFHGDEYSAIYGASGMMLGLMIGSFAGLIQIVISMNLRKREIAETVKNGAPRYLDNKNDVLTGIRPIWYLYASPLLVCLLDNLFFNITQIKKQNTDYMVNIYGAYNGRLVCLVIMIALLCCVPYIKSWNRVMARVERDELEGARDRFKKLFRSLIMFYIPVSICFLVSSNTIEQMFFGNNFDQLKDIYMLGSVMIFLLAMGVFASWLLNHMGKNIIIVVNLTISWIIHIVMLIVLEYVLNMQILGVILPLVISLSAYVFLSLFVIFKMLKVRIDMVKSVGLPLASACISGLVLYAENLIFINLIGEILTFIIGIVLYTVVYMVLMIVLRGVRTHELSRIPFGQLFGGFSAKVQHDKFYEE